MKIKPQFRCKLILSDEQVQQLRDAGDVTKIKVKIEATHSGIVNANKFFYTPAGMKAGTPTFTQPFEKPVMVAHDTDGDPIGRVLKAKYIDYPEITAEFKDVKNPVDIVDQVVKFTKSKDFKKKSYKGLGHVELVAEIADREAIEKILDKRYLTVSIGGSVKSAACSICGTDQMAQDENVPYEDRCNHYRGETYDGEVAFLIGGQMTFDEVSYVATPADKNAVSEVISDNADDIVISEQSLQILDFEVSKEQTGETALKTLKELLADAKAQREKLKDLKLETFILEDEEYTKLRKPSFLFADERAIAINDRAHLLSAKSLMEEIEDSEDKTQIVEVLDRKFKSLFGETISFEDALSKQQAKNEEQIEDSQAAVAPGTTSIEAKVDEEAIAQAVADSVVAAIKSQMSVSDSYSGQRAEALEQEVESLEVELTSITDKYKALLVNQILTSEGKTEDADYKSKLAIRGLDSLHDKLEDLGFGLQASDSVDNEQEVKDNKGLENVEVDINDASEKEGNVADASEKEGKEDKEGTVVDSAEESTKLTIEGVRTAYQQKIKDEGLRKARFYIADLRKNKQLPDNFTF